MASPTAFPGPAGLPAVLPTDRTHMGAAARGSAKSLIYGAALPHREVTRANCVVGWYHCIDRQPGGVPKG